MILNIPEGIADLSTFKPLDDKGKAILFSLLEDGLIDVNIDKISLIQALQEITNHNNAAIDLLTQFTQKENFYIEIDDQPTQKELRSKIREIQTENTIYANMAKRALKYIDAKVQGKDMVTKKSLKEAIQEVMRLQNTIDQYMTIAKQYIN